MKAVEKAELAMPPAVEPVSGSLLVVTESEEVAKRIESHLRNAGHPLRATWLHRLDDVEDLLRRAPPDLLLTDGDVRGAPRDRIILLVRALQPDLPVIVIGRQWSIEGSVAAMAAGAQDFAAFTDEQQLHRLELVVVRELVKHHHLRLLRRTQMRLDDFESRHRQLTDCTGDAIGLVQEGILISANLAFAKLLGFDNPQELAGEPMIDLVDPAQHGTIKASLRSVLKTLRSSEPIPLKLVGKTGGVDVNAQLIPGSQDGEPVIELLIRAIPQETAPAIPAPRGRGAFALALCEAPPDELSARSALLLHIDDFEGLENRIGHADAHEINAQIVAAVQRHLGPQDQLFVFSTDEIALIVVRPDLNTIELFGDFLRKEIKQEVFSAHQHEAQATLSIAIFPLAATDGADTVIRQLAAEARRISAKGGNQLVALSGSVKTAQHSEREDANRAAQVRKALDDDRLTLAYQSIASLEGETRSYYDVLLRMVDEHGREHFAADFLPPAARFNLMRSVDRWVVRATLDIVAQRTGKQESGPTLFVKLSEDTLRDAEAFLVWLRSVTRTRRMKSDEIVFEIQELVLQNHIRKARTLTETLSAMGAGIAIEHFGIGSNSIQLLDHIQAGFLKFHSSFTQNFAEKASQRQLQELLEAAKQRKIKTIVSHVEDANVMAKLWQMGVNFIQGYHIKEPEVVSLTSDGPAAARNK